MITGILTVPKIHKLSFSSKGCSCHLHVSERAFYEKHLEELARRLPLQYDAIEQQLRRMKIRKTKATHRISYCEDRNTRELIRAARNSLFEDAFFYSCRAGALTDIIYGIILSFLPVVEQLELEGKSRREAEEEFEKTVVCEKIHSEIFRKEKELKSDEKFLKTYEQEVIQLRKKMLDLLCEQNTVLGWLNSFNQRKMFKQNLVKVAVCWDGRQVRKGLSLRNEALIIVERTDRGWALGLDLDTNESGWFPAGYCVEIEQPGDDCIEEFEGDAEKVDEEQAAMIHTFECLDTTENAEQSRTFESGEEKGKEGKIISPDLKRISTYSFSDSESEDSADWVLTDQEDSCPNTPETQTRGPTAFIAIAKHDSEQLTDFGSEWNQNDELEQAIWNSLEESNPQKTGTSLPEQPRATDLHPISQTSSKTD